jgi:hypothetical protein
MDVVTEIESASALRYSLIVKPPIADFTTRYPVMKLAFHDEAPIETLFGVNEAGRKIGNCGVTSIVKSQAGSESQSVVHMGLQVWLYDVYSRETSAINLGFPRAYGSRGFNWRLTAKAGTVRPNIGSVYYRETNNLLMQITILSFDTKLSSWIQTNIRSILSRILKKGSETNRYNGVELRLRVWSKSQAAHA